jgi:serine/threonine-protein kinase
MLSEDVEGQSLRQRLRENSHLPYADAMQIAEQIAEALENSHGEGIPHLNLQPLNIMLSVDGVKLAVYEFSRLTPRALISVKRPNDNSEDYLSPEQLAGQEGMNVVIYTPLARFFIRC